MKILVTGASGFIGSFIVEKGLTEGHVIWAGMRAPVAGTIFRTPESVSSN